MALNSIEILRRFTGLESIEGIEGLHSDFMNDIQELYDIEQILYYPRSFAKTGPYGAIYSMLRCNPWGSPTTIAMPGSPAARIFEAMGPSGHTAFTCEGRNFIHHSFLSKHKKLGKLFITLHENGHVLRRHITRKGGRDHRTFNYAGDIKINCDVMTIILPALAGKKEIYSHDLCKDGETPFIGWGDAKETRFLFEKYRGYSEEEIYYELHRHAVAQAEQNQETKPGQGADQAPSGPPQPSSSQNTPQEDSSGEKESTFDDLLDEPGDQNSASSREEQGTSEAESTHQLDEHGITLDDIKRLLEDKFGSEIAKETLRDVGLSDESGKPKAAYDFNRAVTEAVDQSKRVMERAAQLEGGRSPGQALFEAVDQYTKLNEKLRFRVNLDLYFRNSIRPDLKGRLNVDETVPDELSILSGIDEVQEAMNLGGQIFRPDFTRQSGVGQALWIADTSVSVSESERQTFVSYVVQTTKKYPINSTIIPADVTMRAKIQLSNAQARNFKGTINLPGGSGTDMCEPLAQAIAESEKKYSIATILSDGEFKLFTYNELCARVIAHGGRIENIPPISIVVTSTNYFNREFDEVASTFPRRGLCAFDFQTAINEKIKIKITNEDQMIVTGPSM